MIGRRAVYCTNRHPFLLLIKQIIRISVPFVIGHLPGRPNAMEELDVPAADALSAHFGASFARRLTFIACLTRQLGEISRLMVRNVQTHILRACRDKSSCKRNVSSQAKFRRGHIPSSVQFARTSQFWNGESLQPLPSRWTGKIQWLYLGGVPSWPQWRW